MTTTEPFPRHKSVPGGQRSINLAMQIVIVLMLVIFIVGYIAEIRGAPASNLALTPNSRYYVSS